MAMKFSGEIKPSTPWNQPLEKLANLEKKVASGESDAMEARWLFGKELASRRVEQKGRQVIPADLMKLVLEKCALSKREMNYRVQFAVRYPTKDLMRTARAHYPTWTQMKKDGLVEKKAEPKKKTAPPSDAGKWVIRRLTKEVDKAFSHHGELSRDQVNDLEVLLSKIQTLLNQIDQNDEARADVVRKGRTA